jgi:hypothetical protein
MSFFGNLKPYATGSTLQAHNTGLSIECGKKKGISRDGTTVDGTATINLTSARTLNPRPAATPKQKSREKRKPAPSLRNSQAWMKVRKHLEMESCAAAVMMKKFDKNKDKDKTLKDITKEKEIKENVRERRPEGGSKDKPKSGGKIIVNFSLKLKRAEKKRETVPGGTATSNSPPRIVDAASTMKGEPNLRKRFESREYGLKPRGDLTCRDSRQKKLYESSSDLSSTFSKLASSTKLMRHTANTLADDHPRQRDSFAHSKDKRRKKCLLGSTNDKCADETKFNTLTVMTEPPIAPLDFHTIFDRTKKMFLESRAMKKKQTTGAIKAGGIIQQGATDKSNVKKVKRRPEEKEKKVEVKERDGSASKSKSRGRHTVKLGTLLLQDIKALQPKHIDKSDPQREDKDRTSSRIKARKKAGDKSGHEKHIKKFQCDPREINSPLVSPNDHSLLPAASATKSLPILLPKTLLRKLAKGKHIAKMDAAAKPVIEEFLDKSLKPKKASDKTSLKHSRDNLHRIQVETEPDDFKIDQFDSLPKQTMTIPLAPVLASSPQHHLRPPLISSFPQRQPPPLSCLKEAIIENNSIHHQIFNQGRGSTPQSPALMPPRLLPSSLPPYPGHHPQTVVRGVRHRPHPPVNMTPSLTTPSADLPLPPALSAHKYKDSIDNLLPPLNSRLLEDKFKRFVEESERNWKGFLLSLEEIEHKGVKRGEKSEYGGALSRFNPESPGQGEGSFFKRVREYKRKAERCLKAVRAAVGKEDQSQDFTLIRESRQVTEQAEAAKELFPATPQYFPTVSSAQVVLTDGRDSPGPYLLNQVESQSPPKGLAPAIKSVSSPPAEVPRFQISSSPSPPNKSAWKYANEVWHTNSSPKLKFSHQKKNVSVGDIQGSDLLHSAIEKKRGPLQTSRSRRNSIEQNILDHPRQDEEPSHVEQILAPKPSQAAMAELQSALLAQNSPKPRECIFPQIPIEAAAVIKQDEEKSVVEVEPIKIVNQAESSLELPQPSSPGIVAQNTVENAAPIDDTDSLLFATPQEKADIITSFILENLIIEAVSEDHCLYKFVSILGKVCRRLEKEKISDYFERIIFALLCDSKELELVQKRLNTPIGHTDLQRLMLSSPNLTDIDYASIGGLVYEPVLDIKIYVEVEEQMRDIMMTQREMDQTDMEREHIVHKMMFDAFNECLDYKRVYGIVGPGLKFSNNFRTEQSINGEQVVSILQECKKMVLNWATTSAGRLHEKEPFIIHAGDPEEIDRLREKTIVTLVNEYNLSLEEKWQNNNEEYLETFQLITETVLEQLAEEVVLDLNRLKKK